MKNISFSVNENEHITISGPSGCGKTSLLKILSKLENYNTGKIFYAGKDFKELSPISYRQEIAYCFQQPVLFAKTVRDNLAFPFEIRKLELDESRILKSLDSVNLPCSFLDQDICQLSGGEKQRIALIRSLLFSPKVLLLDEVTTGLDADNKDIVRQLISETHQSGTTILEITHDAHEISNASRVLKIVKGELINA